MKGQISIESLMIRLLCRWRWILILAILGGISGCGFGAYQHWSAVKDGAPDQEQIQQYELEMQFYEAQIERMTTLIENEYRQLEQLYSAYQTIGEKLAYYQADQQISIASPQAGVADAYRAFLSDIAVQTELEERFPPQDESVESILEGLTGGPYAVRTGGTTLTIQVFSMDQERCATMMGALLEYLSEAQRAVTQSLGDHTVTVLNPGIQPLQRERAHNLGGQIRDRREIYNSLREAMGQIVAPESLEMNSLSRRQLIKNGVLYGLMGFILLAGASVILFLLIDILNPKIRGVGELEESFGVPVLGIMVESGKGAKS